MGKTLIQFEWKKSKGESFEDLVGALLAQMFPDVTFEKTKYVHDGGKDYFSIGTGADGDIWVEAKNYTSHLELSKFSNTFIMADVAEVNRIIVFSMTALTSGAKTNVARYAAYHKKLISIYAGDDILFLLNHYKASLNLHCYIKNAEEVLAHIENTTSEEHDDAIVVWHDYYQAKQFNLAYRRHVATHIADNVIPCQSLIAQEIHITNQSLLCEKIINIDYSDYDACKGSALECYFCGPRTASITLPPASTEVIVIFLKVASPVEIIHLPQIHIDGSNVNRDENLQPVNCCWLGEIPYMGSGWVKLNKMITEFDGNPKKHFAVLSGKSGVGKTRFLQEAAGYFYQKGYRIISLDFRSLDDLSLRNALYYILSNIYVARTDKESDEEYAYVKGGSELYQVFQHILFDGNSYDCATHMEQISAQLATLLGNKKIVLLLDNVQDVGSAAAIFFEKLISKLGNQENLFPAAILCFNEDYLHPEKASEKLRRYLTQLNGCSQINLTDFSPSDAKLYLRECLDPYGYRFDLDMYFDQIIEKFGGNPFTLKQFILCLKDRGIIQFSDATTYIANFEELKIVLSELPEGVNQVLDCRYQYLLKHMDKITQANMSRVLWSMLFFGRLQDQIIQEAALDLHCVQALFSYGFASRDLNLGIVFSHQLIEKYFCLLFMNRENKVLPALTFLPDKAFLKRLLSVVSKHGETTLCVESMLLRAHLSCTNTQNAELALRTLTTVSPRAIMLPLVWNSTLYCLEKHTDIDPKLEFRAAYALSVASQDRLDVPRAVILSEPFIRFEQLTYEKKTAASEEMVLYFKHFTFQLPVERKFVFLDWLIENASSFGLKAHQLQRFEGWLANRYSKNLSAVHRFCEAKTQAKKALDIALLNKDLESAAEAEIEYGNCFAYSDPESTAEHWEKCVEYICQLNTKSVYFQVCQHAYFMLYKMLRNDFAGLDQQVQALQELRNQTFLYQKLLIDDVCADYYLLSYMEDDMKNPAALLALIPVLTQMKAESYLHTPIFTILATYKLFTVYRLLCSHGLKKDYQATGISLVYELIENGIFEEKELQYSQMILSDVAEYTRGENDFIRAVCDKLPLEAKECYKVMLDKNISWPLDGHATTVLSDSKRRINLLHFNYVF